MGRATYVCTTCSEHFTRKYSAKRHNITVHHNNGGGEIVTLVEYLVGRKSGRYQASDPSWYRRRSDKSIHKFERAMVADSVGDRPGTHSNTDLTCCPLAKDTLTVISNYGFRKTRRSSIHSSVLLVYRNPSSPVFRGIIQPISIISL